MIRYFMPWPADRRERVHMAPEVEFVPRAACPITPPTNEQRWAARKPLYDAVRNKEQYA